jgi:hypothetical protein
MILVSIVIPTVPNNIVNILSQSVYRFYRQVFLSILRGVIKPLEILTNYTNFFQINGGVNNGF